MFLSWKKVILTTGFLGTVLFAMQNLPWAHGPGHMMSEHMKAMYQVKESIPSEFQIMDRTPVAPTPYSLAKGKALYMTNCTVCHGPTGKGDGPAAVGLNPPPADFHDTKHSGIYGPGEKYWIIGNGSGETGMPGFAAQIEPLDRWHLVNFIYSLQGKNTEPRGHTGHEHKPM